MNAIIFTPSAQTLFQETIKFWVSFCLLFHHPEVLYGLRSQVFPLLEFPSCVVQGINRNHFYPWPKTTRIICKPDVNCFSLRTGAFYLLKEETFGNQWQKQVRSDSVCISQTIQENDFLYFMFLTSYVYISLNSETWWADWLIHAAFCWGKPQDCVYFKNNHFPVWLTGFTSLSRWKNSTYYKKNGAGWWDRSNSVGQKSMSKLSKVRGQFNQRRLGKAKTIYNIHAQRS